MTKLGLSLKISVPKKQKTVSKSIVKIEATDKKGTVFIDEKGDYKVSISMNNDIYNPSLLIVPFTEKSFDIKGRVNVFSRKPDKKGRYTRYVRSEEKAKFFPGDPNNYVPFAPNWIVKGNLIRENTVLKFEFKSLITIKGYIIMIKDDDE